VRSEGEIHQSIRATDASACIYPPLYSPTVLKQPSEKIVDDACKREHRKE